MEYQSNISKEIELCSSQDRVSFWKSFSNLFEITTLANTISEWYSMDSEELYRSNSKKSEIFETYRDGDIKYSFNEYGFRTVPFTKEMHKDFNILVGGCSITAGVGLPEDHVWPHLITDMIRHDLGPNMQPQYFNIALGGRSIESVSRYLYLVISKKLVKPDLVLLNLPPIWRKELAVFDHGFADILHYIPNSNHRNKSFKKYTEFVSDIQSLHETIRNLLFIQQILKNEDIPWMFSFWDNHLINYSNKHDSKSLCEHLERESPEELLNHFAGDLSMCADNFIESYKGLPNHRPFWEFKYPQKIARDLAHYGPNSQNEFAAHLYYKLKKSNTLQYAISKANERKKTDMF